MAEGTRARINITKGQIPQMMERHGLKSGVMGVLIVMIGLGAFFAHDIAKRNATQADHA